MGSVLRGVGGDLQGIGDRKCRGAAPDVFAVSDACFAFFDVFPLSDAAPESTGDTVGHAH
jgi:ferredoxin